MVVVALLLVLHSSSKGPRPGAGRKWKRARDYQQREDESCFKVALGFVALILLVFIWVLPPLNDYQNNSVVQTVAIYSRDSNDYHSRTPNVGGSVHLTINGETFSVELYPGYSEADFPEGTFSATVLYGESSRILLDLEIH